MSTDVECDFDLKLNLNLEQTVSPSPVEQASTGSVIGIDLGGTNFNIGRVSSGQLQRQRLHAYDATASKDEIVDLLVASIEAKLDESVAAIGIGVPALVDVERGIVFDAINIPAWKEVHLKQLLQDHFKLPVAINNDVNCFALGERQFGSAQGCDNVVGICLGTGLGMGIIINGQLYAGNTCGAGELGEISYRDGVLENYCSGQFFQRLHQTSGRAQFDLAEQGNVQAMRLLHEFGSHIGSAISTVLLAYDPKMIVIGGSVAKARKYFSAGMDGTLANFPFQNMLRNCRIEFSQTEHVAVLGAAALHTN